MRIAAKPMFFEQSHKFMSDNERENAPVLGWEEWVSLSDLSLPAIKSKVDTGASNGVSELRYVIRAKITVGGRSWPIDVSLTNRETMGYRMLLGRSAIPDDISVRPGTSFQQPVLSYDVYRKKQGRKSIPKRPLRIGILTQSPNNYSNRKMIAAAEKRGEPR